MRAPVAAAWPAMCDRYEGRCSWMYLDTKKLVTTGLGFLIDSIDASQALPWLDKSVIPASRNAIATEWRRVKGRTDLAPKGGFAFRPSAQLHLADDTIDMLLMAKTATFWARLRQTLPAIDTFPADAQLALLDLSWQNGPAFLDTKSGSKYIWPNMRAGTLAQDWTKAASAVPGTGTRAEARKRLFRNAAKVKAASLDPEVLWDTKTPAGPATTPPVTPPPVITPAPQEPAVKHSKTYDSDYVWFRGGNVPPLVATILTAIPSPVTLSQGGLSTSVAASARTHNGLGAYDISVKGWSKAKILELCAELIRSGECAFPRGGWFGSAVFSTHVHVCSNNTYGSLHAEAKAQVQDFKKSPRRNGLVGHGKYVGPSTPLGSWKTSPYNPANIRAVEGGKQAFYVNVTTKLLGLDVDRKTKQERGRGELIYAVKLVDRWGRLNAVTESGTYYALDYLSPTPLDQPTPAPTEAP